MFSASKLCQSSSISGPSATTKPPPRKICSMRRRERVTGCSPPRLWPRPGNVTSTVSLASCAASCSPSSAARRASSAAVSASLASLIFAPASLRASGSIAPSDLSCAVISPFLPSRRTRICSNSSMLTARAISARAASTSDCISGSLLEQAVFRLLRDHAECRRIVHRDVGEHLAVHLQPRQVEPGDQLAVRQTVDPRFGIDARDPQRAHGALVGLAIAVSVLAGLDDRLLRRAEDLATGVVVALR